MCLFKNASILNLKCREYLNLNYPSYLAETPPHFVDNYICSHSYYSGLFQYFLGRMLLTRLSCCCCPVWHSQGRERDTIVVHTRFIIFSPMPFSYSVCEVLFSLSAIYKLQVLSHALLLGFTHGASCLRKIENSQISHSTLPISLLRWCFT